MLQVKHFTLTAECPSVCLPRCLGEASSSGSPEQSASEEAARLSEISATSFSTLALALPF